MKKMDDAYHQLYGDMVPLLLDQAKYIFVSSLIIYKMIVVERIMNFGFGYDSVSSLGMRYSQSELFVFLRNRIFFWYWLHDPSMHHFPLPSGSMTKGMKVSLFLVVEVKKQISITLQLSNKTHVAFMVLYIFRLNHFKLLL